MGVSLSLDCFFCIVMEMESLLIPRSRGDAFGS